MDRSASGKTNRNIEDHMRVNRSIWKDTYGKSEYYNHDPSEKINTDTPDTHEAIAKYIENNQSTPVMVKVFNEDIYSVLDTVAAAGFRNPDPLLINAANNNYPIEGVKKGADTPEADLYRRSNICLAIDETQYPLMDEQLLYSPTVVIFKNSQYKKLEKPVQVSVASIPPLRRPGLMGMQNPEGKGYIDVFQNSSDEKRAQQKIDMMFKLAILHGHDMIIVTNFGGGVYENPMTVIIDMFNRAIAKYRIPFVFFAIKTHEKRERDQQFLLFHKKIKRSA